MTKQNINSTLLLIAPCVFLLILPFSHTVSLRLLSLFALFISAVFLYRKMDVPPIPLKLPVAIWLMMALLSVSWAVDPAYSLSEIKVEIGYGMLAFFGFFVLSKSSDNMKLMMVFLILSGVAISLGIWIRPVGQLAYGIWEVSPEIRRLLPGVGNTSTFIICVIPLVFFLTWEIWHSNKAPAIRGIVGLVAVLVIGILLLGIIGSQNRMAWLVMGVQAFFVLALWGNISRPLKFAIFLVLSLALVAAYSYLSLQRSQMTALSVDSVASSLQDDPRAMIWKRVLPIIANKPWTGEGFGRRALAKSHVEFSGDIAFWHAHNLFLDYAVQMGIFGVFALLLLFYTIAYTFWRYLGVPHGLHWLGITGLVILLGLIMKNMTDDFFNRDLALLFWAEMGLLMGWGERLLRQTTKDENETSP